MKLQPDEEFWRLNFISEFELFTDKPRGPIRKRKCIKANMFEDIKVKSFSISVCAWERYQNETNLYWHCIFLCTSKKSSFTHVCCTELRWVQIADVWPIQLNCLFTVVAPTHVQYPDCLHITIYLTDQPFIVLFNLHSQSKDGDNVWRSKPIRPQR